MKSSVFLIASAVGISLVNSSALTSSADESRAEFGPSAVAAHQVAKEPSAPPPPAPVPDIFDEWIVKASHTCEGITRGLIAAQLFSESSFRLDAVSYANALGPGQFIPETWNRWGVDADRNGSKDPFSPADSVMALADFMCHNVAEIQAGIEAGKIKGDAVDLALAAYNAGLGAVEEARGMPTGGDYTTQTQPYVAKIRGLERSYEAEFERRA